MQSCWTKPLLTVVALLAVGALDRTAEASILLPTQPSLDSILEIDVESDEPSSAPASGTPAAPADVPSGPSKLNDLQTPCPASSNGAATGSGAGSGASGATGLSEPAVMTSDADLVGWLLSEFSLSVPDPPGSDLLRPPQTQLTI